MILFQDQLSW